MAKQLDVYRDWLGIAETARPLNHYQLLRLKAFEDDPGKVREHYRKMNAHVRKYAAGEFAKQSQDLLNELAKSMLCLTDSRRKSEYDVSLGRTTKGTSKARTMEELLLARKVVDAEKLAKARNFAKAVGVEVRDALLQQKLANPEDVVPAYAESIGLPYLDLADVELDVSLIPQVPVVIARQHSCVPVLVDQNQLLMASPSPLDPNIEEELRLRFNMPVRTVLCTPAAVNQAIAKHYSRDAASAELAAGVDARHIGRQAPSAAGAPAATVKAGPAAGSPEAAKQRRMVALVTFNFAGMLTIFAQMALLDNSLLAKLGLGLLVGCVAGGIAYAVAK